MAGKILESAGSNWFYLAAQDSAIENPAKAARNYAQSGVTPQNAAGSQPGGDTVSISEKARKLSGEADYGKDDAKKSGVFNASAMLAGENGEQQSGTDTVESIRKQIEEVNKKLQDAQARLAKAQGNSGSAAPESGEDPAEAAMRAAMQALNGSAEAEAIQAEIKMLTQQLMMLNEQLREATEAMGGSMTAAGSAGLGGAGGRGGLGERIPVNS